MNDEEAVRLALKSLKEGEVIDDGTARTIASWMSDNTTIPFVSSGHIYGEVDQMMHDFMLGMDYWTISELRPELTALKHYLEDRTSARDYASKPNWHYCWVR